MRRSAPPRFSMSCKDEPPVTGPEDSSVSSQRCDLSSSPNTTGPPELRDLHESAMQLWRNEPVMAGAAVKREQS